MFKFQLAKPNEIDFVLGDAAGNEVSGIGAGFTLKISVGAAALATGVGAKSEIGQGVYRYVATAGECSAPGAGMIVITAPGCVQQNLPITIEAPVAGGVPFVYTLTSSVDSSPIAAAEVIVTSDALGATVIDRGVTGIDGKVTFVLPPGTYYLWRAKAGWTFANPDTEVVA